MKKTIVVGIFAVALAVALATVNAAPAIPGLDPKNLKIDPKALGISKDQAEQIQQGVNAATGIAEANQAWSFKEERATGRVLAARVASSFGGTLPQDSPWSIYVNKIGRGLAPLSGRPDIKYRFAVLKSKDVNAYSCPGGYIFVTRGLLMRVKSEAQLAGVLAHEIAHISRKHIEKEVRKQKIAGVALESGLNFAASEGKIDKGQADIMKKLGDAGYDILVKKGYAREDEYEADELAVKTMMKMGYNPAELSAFIAGLGSAKSGDLSILVSTHPASEDRVKKIDGMKNKKWDGLAVLSDRLEALRSANPL